MKYGKKNARLMTSGTIWKHLILFAIPLLIGNLFQQMYNTVDSIIVGRFVSTQALAAVGSTTPIINTLVGFFLGLSTGAGVIISQRFGARDEKGVHDAVHTTLMMTLGLSVVISIVGCLLVPLFLRMMKTPADVFPESSSYLRIYFAGVAGLMFYNMGSGILRAVGDSRRPLYFLIFSSVLNVILDLLFVVAFHLGIAGVAYATILSQIVSALMILYVIAKTEDCYRFIPSHLKIEPDVLMNIFRVGLPGGIQMAVTSFSNVFVQSYINNFGSAAMAGWGSYSKIDQFILLPMQSLALSSTTFVGQNLGAMEIDRAKKGTYQAFFFSFFVTIALTVVVIWNARPLLLMFTTDPAVLDYGEFIIRLLSPFYCVCCANQIFAGSLRGAGDAKAPMYIMLGCFVFFRQIFLFVGTKFIKAFTYVAFGYPAGWLLCSIIMITYYRKSGWEEKWRRTQE